MREVIICSAIHFDDKKKHKTAPLNIASGFVACGRRHSDCYAIVEDLVGKEAAEAIRPVVPGFLTNLNRFVTRTEGMVIAKRENQLLVPSLHEGLEDRLLTSEDLYPFTENE